MTTSEDRPYQYLSAGQLDTLFARYSIMTRREVRLQSCGLKCNEAKLTRLERKMVEIDKERDRRMPK